MNRKIIFSPDHSEQFEIQHTFTHGYRIFRLNEAGQPQQIGEFYRNASELVDGLVELAIFNGEAESTLNDIQHSIQAVADTVRDYCVAHSGF